MNSRFRNISVKLNEILESEESHLEFASYLSLIGSCFSLCSKYTLKNFFVGILRLIWKLGGKEKYIKDHFPENVH